MLSSMGGTKNKQAIRQDEMGQFVPSTLMLMDENVGAETLRLFKEQGGISVECGMAPHSTGIRLLVFWLALSVLKRRTKIGARLAGGARPKNKTEIGTDVRRRGKSPHDGHGS